MMLNETHFEILRMIASNGSVTRAHLIQHLHLSQASVSNLCKDLIKNNFIIEGQTQKGFGRPAVELGLAPDGRYFIGISMMTEPAQILLIDFSGQKLAQSQLQRDLPPKEFADAISEQISILLAETNISAQKISGIGLTLSGLIDQSQRICLKSTLLGWQDVPFADMIEAATGLPCAIENDAKSLALHAKIFGAARSFDSLSLLWIGDGIGAAHWVNGKILRGAHGGGGEIAHATITLGGQPCRCGKTGCLDTVASVIAILEAARSEGLDVQSIEELETLAAQGSSSAIRILHRAGSALGLTIAQIIQFNDPSAVLILHDKFAQDGLLFTVLEQTVEQNVLPRLSGQTPLHITKITDDSWARAAASVATYRFLHP